MDLLARSNNTIILPQRPPKTKVKRFTPRIRNNTPTFLHEQRPGRVILKNRSIRGTPGKALNSPRSSPGSQCQSASGGRHRHRL